MLKLSRRVSLQSFTEELGYKDYRRTLKWLQKRNIPCKKEGRGYYILRWHIEFSNLLEIAEDLKKRFPSNWFKIFEATVEDNNMVQAVFEVLPPNSYTQKRNGNNSGHKFFK